MGALTSALFTGLSGLDVNTTEMNVVGNNIANSNTTAFKSSRVLDTPQFYVTSEAGTPPSAENGGSNPSQYGLGASVADIQPNFTPGAIQSTGVDTDLAIDGNGFFVINNGGVQQYTRAGTFTLNSANQLVTNSGAYVQGYAAQANGTVASNQLSNITIPLGDSSLSTPTTQATLSGNLNASGAVAAGASILTSGDVTTIGGAAAPTATDLLTNVASVANDTTPLFNVGDTLTLSGTVGGATQPAKTFTVTATSTVQDLLTFYNQSLGIDTTVANPNVPTPGANIENDPATPNAAQFVITGNEGTANALEIPASDFTNQNSVTPLNFADGTDPISGVASNPSGESVNTTLTAYDSLGNPVNINVTAVLESTSNAGNTWRFFATSPDNTQGGASLGDGTLTFNSQGDLEASTGTTINVDRAGTGAQSPMSITLNFSSVSELSSSSSSLVVADQNGMPPGTLSSFSVGTDGTITGAYSNGLTRSLGQVAVANFANPDGLNNIGGNIYTQGANSGTAAITTAGQLGTGAIRAGALELSNVDLSTEFTNLIIASTGFSASSKVISTSDELIQDLLNSQH